MCIECWKPNMDVVKKGDIVWYYTVKKEWRKGKVICVNRRYLLIKQRNRKGNVYIGLGNPVRFGWREKPTHNPNYYYAVNAMNSSWRGNDKNGRLRKKLGLLVKE